MKMIMRVAGAAALACAPLIFGGCFSVPAAITDETTAEEIIQYAQTALERDQYNRAIQYYKIILDRFPFNDEKVCDAEYGIASVHYYQKKYNLAKDELNAILAKYDEPGSGELSKKYQILAQTRLEYIAKKQKARPLFFGLIKR